MSNYRIDRNRTLRDYRGNRIGEVDYWNRVRDGYRDRGHVDANDRYVDEYGRDQGWALPDYGGDGGGGLVLLLVMGFVALIVWLISALSEVLTRSKSRPARAPAVSPARPLARPHATIHTPTAKNVRIPPPSVKAKVHPPSSKAREGIRPASVKPPRPRIR